MYKVGPPDPVINGEKYLLSRVITPVNLFIRSFIGVITPFITGSGAHLVVHPRLADSPCDLHSMAAVVASCDQVFGRAAVDTALSLKIRFFFKLTPLVVHPFSLKHFAQILWFFQG